MRSVRRPPGSTGASRCRGSRAIPVRRRGAARGLPGRPTSRPTPAARRPPGSRAPCGCASGWSGRISNGSTTPPSRATSARSTTEFESTMQCPLGTLPAGSSSSPVTISATRGRRTQRALATPIAASSPASCGRRRRPARSTTSPAFTSSPIAPTCLRGATGSRTSRRPSRSLATSAITTASAPSGSGAPVMMRTAWPAATRPSNARPGSATPITSNAIGS